MAIEGDKAAVAFSATEGLEPPLRNLITFARAGASFRAKKLCSNMLMTEIDPDQVRKEDLAAGQGTRFGQVWTVVPRSGPLEQQAASARKLNSADTDGFAGIQAGPRRALAAQPPQIKARSAQCQLFS